MDQEVRDKVRELIDFLDTKMESAPSRELADLSNYLEDKLGDIE